MNNCLCIICFKPNDLWIEFLSKFVKYDIYIIIDDNSFNYVDKYKDNKKINIIQVVNQSCKINGFINMNFTIKKYITGWEKAMYYFSSVNLTYDNVWFLEDDVFFYNEETLCNIDLVYTNSDLLSKTIRENKTGYKNDWLWPMIDIKLKPPYYACLCCAVRMSKQMLSKIKDYATIYKTLFFLEALFPTICKKNNLIYHTPPQFNSIIYRKDYNVNEINKFGLYHPVKNLNLHTLFRNIIQ